eukprot:snap_masked-scaffold93_size381549-processed-gene-2.18 protein:Tk04409 transcript:snap_masked-scaffold93_size381549-processed-gene-2.18-mRNA-1 annotation:"vacuolar proton translocating atpase 116 kda subunit a"
MDSDDSVVVQFAGDEPRLVTITSVEGLGSSRNGSSTALGRNRTSSYSSLEQSATAGACQGLFSNMCSFGSDAALFRSEPMSRCQLILQSEAAYNCIAELGELGLVQFVDLNPDVSSFQRKFVGEVKRCEEMERKMRYIQRETMRDDIPLLETDENPRAPAPREMSELETSLTNLERDLSDVTTNYVSLMKNQQDLLEIKNLLIKADSFLSDSSLQIADSTHDEESRNTDDANLIDIRADEGFRSMKFNITAGVVERTKVVSFERLLWRVSKGNVFIRFSEIEDTGANGALLDKTVFMIFYQGEALKSRVKKICEGYHAVIYPCPEKASERREMLYGVNTRLEDMRTVLEETENHRRRLLQTGASHLRLWFTKIRKIKAIYHCLNLFSFDVTQKAMVAECWMPENDLQVIQEALRRGAETSGSTIPPILNLVTYIDETPPTFNRLSKYTAGFQNLVDSYGVNSYREVNPAVYTIATFPFLFAVMFGDVGHALVMFFAGLWMVMQEKKLEKAAEKSEIFGIFFGGRYIVLLMGLFSIYTGFIYNDIFSKSLNMFGSRWNYNETVQFPLNMKETVMLDPGNRAQYVGTPYVFGLDPAWALASNKINFLNGYKMKISLIFGLFHMVFGLTLCLWNKMLKRSYADIFLEFIPQLYFIVSIFMYLIFMIFYKWTHYYADNATQETNVYSEHCAPNLLITFINMMLFKGADPDPKLVSICKGRETFMYPGQYYVQVFLVLSGVLMVPIMLFGKPVYTVLTRRARRRNYEPMADQLLDAEGGTSLEEGNDDQVEIRNGQNRPTNQEGEGELEFGEIMIYQSIHTIEYVLGTVSHTASYLRLWALSLAHSQLSEVLWTKGLAIPLEMKNPYVSIPMLFVIFSFWAMASVAILVVMEGLSAFLHTLRLHWVEFQSKFYKGEGVLFVPFHFKGYLKEAETEDLEVLKGTP